MRSVEGIVLAAAYTQSNGVTQLPLKLDPCGSQFVVFREPAQSHPAQAKRNEVRYSILNELSGPWTVAFDTKWGGPASARFDKPRRLDQSQ